MEAQESPKITISVLCQSQAPLEEKGWLAWDCHGATNLSSVGLASDPSLVLSADLTPQISASLQSQ